MADFSLKENRRERERPTKRTIATSAHNANLLAVNRGASYSQAGGPEVGLTIYLAHENDWGNPSLHLSGLTPAQAREIARMLLEGATAAETMAANNG